MFEISILSSESVLTLALVVLVEPLEGQILMDGLDISNMGLQDFRSKVRYNSSRNQVVSRIIRTNLDPVEQPSDQEDETAEDAKNWSVGLRQLVFLARVLLK
ncbi:hypothetical protein Patl1_16863 [Pistacia atlantica]|uniref:Uncharacterized protein n=1 Tax=Pistacia atlantica TaxID=434234 RepID=A0ACC1B6X9_9ROSI|nr:hypothetical protein Patl1_16863 [Pistacia atlantica]